MSSAYNRPRGRRGFRQAGPMSESIRSYQDLLVWKKGMLLIDEIDRIVDQFDSYRRWWIGLQMHRAALSITSNIAEGHDSDYTRVYLRNLSDAKGSAREVESVSYEVRASTRTRKGDR